MNLEKLDRVFSKWVRLRDANEAGYCTCCFCEKPVKWTDAEACHFVDRRHLSTRFHEKNVHAGHILCNRENDLGEYANFLRQKYGDGVPQELAMLHRQVLKLSQKDVQYLENKYLELIRLEQKAKGL